ncbi:MAG: hypothetical protein RIS73_65 [Bacteroidota bacterium]
MKQILCVLLICCCMQYGSQAQSSKSDKPTYKTAIGLRFSPLGISFKANNKQGKTSFELIGYFKDGFTASGLYYWNFTLNEPANLKLYAGGGGQVGFKDESAGGGSVLGVGGILGVDYKFLHMPLNLSLDWQPSFQFGKNNDFHGWGGIAARFTL